MNTSPVSVLYPTIQTFKNREMRGAEGAAPYIRLIATGNESGDPQGGWTTAQLPGSHDQRALLAASFACNLPNAYCHSGLAVL